MLLWPCARSSEQFAPTPADEVPDGGTNPCWASAGLAPVLLGGPHDARSGPQTRPPFQYWSQPSPRVMTARDPQLGETDPRHT